jgi:hypothetical protein
MSNWQNASANGKPPQIMERLPWPARKENPDRGCQTLTRL